MATPEVPSTCPACGQEASWIGLDDIIELPVQGQGTDRRKTGTRYRAIEVSAPTCVNCGYMPLFERWPPPAS